MLTISPSPAHLAAAAAIFCASVISEAVNRRGRCTVLLAGGSTPQALYEMLSRVPFADNLPWAQVVVGWGDERLVPPDDDRSNQRMAFRALLDAVPLRKEVLLTVDTTLPAAAAAAAYEDRLRAFFALPPGEFPEFDLVLLGLGADGHTASLFPGMAAVEETTRWVVATPAPDPTQPARLTVTLPVLNAARVVVFLAHGAAKASILRQLLGKPSEAAAGVLPAQRVLPTHAEAQVQWFIDEAAAAELR